jgi:hypothetical protein
MNGGAVVASTARLVLAAVLLFSAVAKLRAREVSRTQIVALVGTRSGPAVAHALPFVELLVALALVCWWSVVPGVVAFALVCAFTVVLVRARARHLPCACFGGGVHTRPVGAAGIVRNGALMALAVLATGSPAGAFSESALARTLEPRTQLGRDVEPGRCGEQRDAGREQCRRPAEDVDVDEERGRGGAEEQRDEEVLGANRAALDPLQRRGKPGRDERRERDMEHVPARPERGAQRDEEPERGHHEGLAEHESREQRNRHRTLHDSVGTRVDGSGGGHLRTIRPQPARPGPDTERAKTTSTRAQK